MHGARYIVRQQLSETIKILKDVRLRDLDTQTFEEMPVQEQWHMGHNVRKPVFGVSDKARLKPVSSGRQQPR